MFKNYFIVAIRHLTRHKLFSIINIFCLAIGITFSMLIGIYILKQENVNSNLKDVSNQYLIKSKWKVKEMGLEITTLAPLAKTLKEEYPTLVAGYFRFDPITNVVSAGEQHFKEDMAICDTSLVSMYGFPLLYGNKEHAFANNNSAVITETMAMKLFGKKDVLNKIISVHTTVNGASQDYSVSAVLKDIPYNSVTNLLSDTYGVYMPAEGNHYFQGGFPLSDWNNPYDIDLIELKPGVTPKDLVQPFKQILAKYTSDRVKNNLTIQLAPIKDYNLTQDKGGAMQKMINTLAIIAFFILLMAIINFININIGTSSYRLKEIGLRKVFGSARKQLIFQFIIESLLLAFIASLLSVFLYELLLPVFTQVFNTTLIHFWQFNLLKISSLLLLVLFVGFVSGIYPAFVLSASNVITSIKGKIDTAKGGLTFRKTLLVVQFSLAIIIFIGAVTVSRQVSFVFNKDLGYDKNQVLVVYAFPKQWDSLGVVRMQNIKQGLLQLPVVKDASLSFEIPERTPPNASDLLPENTTQTTPLLMSTIDADEGYASTFGLHLTQGTFLNSGHAGYIPHQVVLNESAVKAFGLKGNITGQKIKWVSGNVTFTVSGVVKDFNYSTMQQSIGPIAIMNVKDGRAFRYLSVKLNSANIQQAIETVKNKWKEMSPTSPFEYFFMDEKFQSLYQTELQLKQAANISTFLMLIIVFLGIFGVVAFGLSQRNKEIAVRKVIGANVRDIIFLFIKDYAALILIANIIAWPLAYILTNHWLENYAYRVSQNILPFIFVGLFTFLSAFMLIAAQCFKVAISNPVNSLKYE